MVITLTPDLAAALTAQAQRRGITPEALALSALRVRFLPAVREPRDDWERKLRAIATDCGVSLSDEAVSSEGLYD